jgi:cytochrome d ubiquinol oxidase subunit II
VPLDATGAFRGTLVTFLNPFGLLGGVLFLSLFLVHGATWLAMKTEGELNACAARAANRLWFVLAAAAAAVLGTSAFATNLLDNYRATPGLFSIVVLTLVGLVATKLYLVRQGYWRGWITSAVTILGVTFYGITGLYPAMLPSSLDPAFSITVHDAASSTTTLTIMLVVALLFLPVVIAYQIWVVRLFKNPLTEEELRSYGTHY